MRQQLFSAMSNDKNGNPMGGKTSGTGIDIWWQDGPLAGESKKEPNGAFVEGVIQAAIDRLNFFQDSKFKGPENALAITKLEEALHWLDHRTRDREERKVEGTHQV